MDAATLLTLRVPDFEAAIRKAVDARLASRPVAVVSSFKPLGRVLAACPEARAAGIAPEMHYPTARDRCPDATFFVPDRRLAEKALRALLKRALVYSPQVEPAGGGRILLDTRGTEKLWGDGGRVAERAQRDIGERLRLPLSAGLAARRPWSLLASRAAGFGGIHRVDPGSEAAFLDRVPVAWLDGVAAGTRARLVEMNIRSVGQLRQFGRGDIARQFGEADGEALWGVLHPHPWRIAAAGEIVHDITEEAVRVEAALAEPSADWDKARLVARALTSQAAATLRARDLGTARLRLSLLHADGATKSAAAGTGGFIQDEAALTAAALRLLERIFRRRVRFTRLWLAAERLSQPERQGVLFPEEPETGQEQISDAAHRRADRLLGTLDRIRGRYGEEALRPAAMVGFTRTKALLNTRNAS